MDEKKKTEVKAEGKDKPDHKKVRTAEGWKRALLKKNVNKVCDIEFHQQTLSVLKVLVK